MIFYNTVIFHIKDAFNSTGYVVQEAFFFVESIRSCEKYEAIVQNTDVRNATVRLRKQNTCQINHKIC
ncbi:hypothetical protein PAESOLCIP111_00188 [Paenibacillus solanacearum]|uniref:Uncharacterized protein n=1 Tax=Paenibacillus solanacearum TaxID=2048548 RepID=A0A916JRL9_9BACL|nr:hypothetical protein PAESOLCIP111_00188 [Paenibacillus solanacearum]